MTDFWRRMRLGTLVAAVALVGVLALSGCGDDDKDKNKDEYTDKPVNTLYNDGMNALAEERYQDAAKSFDEVEREHPYSMWATKAQLMAAYSLYQNDSYDDAINDLDRFIQLHPGNRDIAYAYYLKALCYYEQVTDVERDQSASEKALSSFQELIRRYPDTPYARDGRKKLDLVKDHLAGKEMEVGRFYEDRGQYLAAINRFKTVVDKYQTTTQVPEALYRLIECYMALGIVDEARRTAAVLGYNYPNSSWYREGYQLVANVKLNPGTGKKADQSILGRAWNAIDVF
ncbi:MAG TPA: outer membrane protein assembly factor BamD [Alphaproteobacteria bacterium]|nr:outer membrane protein assembly factor BamD [Alphaproteobacteria bacterium]